MKVGVYLTDINPNDGGSYTFQADIFEALKIISPLTSHQFVLIGDFAEDIKGELKSSTTEFISYRLDFWGKLVKRSLNWSPLFYKIWRRTSKLEGLIKIHNIDILWFVSPDFIPANVPYIVSIWDLQHRLQPWFPEVSHDGLWDLRERSHAKMLRSASIIITGTEVGKKEVEYFYQVPPDNIKVVPFASPTFALNIDRDVDKSKEKRNPPFTIPNCFNIENFLFYPAQFWAHKNHIGLLLAVQILRDRHNLNLPIVFVGADKGNQKYIEQVVTDLQLEQVYFLGFVEQEQLVWLYLHAFALVFPTFFGPDNLPPLEAFALGCPVIASRVAGAVEQLGNAALLFDPTRPEELAIAIESLWSNLELRQGFIDRGLLRAHEWTAINYVQNICQILDEFALIRRCWINSQ